jgi:hypothetical protein
MTIKACICRPLTIPWIMLLCLLLPVRSISAFTRMKFSTPLAVRQLQGCKSAHHTRRCLTLGSSSCSSNEMDEFMTNLGKLLDRSEEEEAQHNKSKTPKVEDDGWKRIDWKHRFEAWRALALPATEGSPVEPVLIRNRLVYMKRDDQIKLAQGAPISGNKVRKMKSLHQLTVQEFPACVVSFGGPQSNAMLALAAIVHFQNQQAEECDDSKPKTENTLPLKKRFVYYTKTLPRFLRKQPNGNLFRAQALGMELVELSPKEYASLFGGEWGGPTEPPPIDPPVPGDSLWVCFCCLPCLVHSVAMLDDMHPIADNLPCLLYDVDLQ